MEIQIKEKLGEKIMVILIKSKKLIIPLTLGSNDRFRKPHNFLHYDGILIGKGALS